LLWQEKVKRKLIRRF